MIFHVVAPSYAPITKERATCPFVGLTLRFCQMMHSLGHTVVHYGAEGSEVAGEQVTVVSAAEQKQWFGQYEPEQLPNVDWSGRAVYWTIYNQRVLDEIKKRAAPHDFVCLLIAQNSWIVDQLPKTVLPVAYAIGHDAPFAPFRVYASYSNLHRFLGASLPPMWYHAVIPHYFDPNDFPLQKKKKDYFVFMGRLCAIKGLEIAVQVCKKLGVKLMIAGPGAKSYTPRRLVYNAGVITGDIEYVGCVNGDRRAQLLGEAQGCFAPSQCTEGFCNVAVEAQLTGTPAITTDWGGFVDTVEHGKTGYRCRTLDHFLFAARNVHTLDSQYIHDRAVAKYSMDNVRYRYQEYFQMLSDSWQGGWDTERERTQLDWLL